MTASAAQRVCKHASFEANARVVRLAHHEGGPIVSYTVDISVHCTQCGLPFRWVGVAPGSSPFEPRVSADATELRAPLEPAIVPEILGAPLVVGRA